MARTANYLLKAPIVARNYVPPHDGKYGKLYDDERAAHCRAVVAHPGGQRRVGVGESAVFAYAYRQTLRDWAAAQRSHITWLDCDAVAATSRRRWLQYRELGFSPPLIRPRNA